MPIKEISAESVIDKSIRHGHISTLHLWWARRPITVCRAAQENKYTNAINIKGEYLKKYGFEQGDFVKVSVTKNKITIEKNVVTGILTCMGTKNPALCR